MSIQLDSWGTLAAEPSFDFDHCWARFNGGRLADTFNCILPPLGKGTYGIVMKCEYKRADGLFRAVKVMQLKNREDRVKKELDIHRRLDHPNVVRVHEFFEEDGFSHLVMELCTGRTLTDLVKRPDGLSQKKAADFIRQIIDVMCYLHALSVAHRDMKPDNFLLSDDTPDAVLKLADFGLSCDFGRLRASNVLMQTQVGTWAFMAPEVLMCRDIGHKGYDEKCDIWSCGVLSYLLLSPPSPTRYPPFLGTPAEIAGKIKLMRYEFPSPDFDDVHEKGKVLISTMLTPALARPSALELRNDSRLEFLGPRPAAPPCEGWLRTIQEFPRLSKIERVARTVLVQQLAYRQVEAQTKLFQALDADGDGRLSLQDVKQFLTQQSIEAPHDLNESLKRVDSDRSGKIDYSEFLAAAVDRKLLENQQICRWAFCMIDFDQDDEISKDDLKKLLNPESNSADAKFQRMIDEINRDDDGRMDFNRFCTMLGGDVEETRISAIEQPAEAQQAQQTVQMEPLAQQLEHSETHVQGQDTPSKMDGVQMTAQAQASGSQLRHVDGVSLNTSHNKVAVRRRAGNTSNENDAACLAPLIQVNLEDGQEQESSAQQRVEQLAQQRRPPPARLSRQQSRFTQEAAHQEGQQLERRPPAQEPSGAQGLTRVLSVELVSSLANWLWTAPPTPAREIVIDTSDWELAGEPAIAAQAPQEADCEEGEGANQEKTKQLIDLGFDHAHVKAALDANCGDPERAADWLFCHAAASLENKRALDPEGAEAGPAERKQRLATDTIVIDD